MTGLMHFDNVGADKVLWIREKLTGKAHVAYTCLGNEVQQSYARAKAKLQD